MRQRRRMSFLEDVCRAVAIHLTVFVFSLMRDQQTNVYPDEIYQVDIQFQLLLSALVEI